MEIHDKYIIYTTPSCEVPRQSGEAVKMTRGLWQKEMVEYLSLFERKQTRFSPVAMEKQEGEMKDISPGEATVSEVSSEQAAEIVNKRSGSILGKGMILKADQYPGIHRKRLQSSKDPQPLIEGAPNYRKVRDEEIYGVAQPTIDGIRNVLKDAGAAPGGNSPPRKAVWTNLREEPVIYINGRPFNLRKNDSIFKNLDRPGTSTRDIEKMEEQLKKEMLKEAAKNGGRILIHDETPDGKIVTRWEEVKPESIKTTSEVLESLKKEGYNIDYDRIPITDEKKPEDKDYDALVNRLKNVDPESAVIFNCHAGRGRTTTAMVAASLMRRSMDSAKSSQKITKNRSLREDIKEQADYKAGEYRVILGLIRLLEGGAKTKEDVDETIDKYSSLQNLREAILESKNKADSGETDSQRKEAQVQGKQYLERYFSIISFDAYLKEQAPAGFKKSYSQWMKEHPEYNRLIENIELALGYRIPAGEGERVAYA